jgi:hypothetical protein
MKSLIHPGGITLYMSVYLTQTSMVCRYRSCPL